MARADSVSSTEIVLDPALDLGDESGAESDVSEAPLEARRRRATRSDRLHCRADTKSFHELTGTWDFLADNEHIVGGYRVAYSWKQTFFSLFQVHNESMNVWSHLTGALIFLLLFVHILAHIQTPPPWSTDLPSSKPLVVSRGIHTSRILERMEEVRQERYDRPARLVTHVQHAVDDVKGVMVAIQGAAASAEEAVVEKARGVARKLSRGTEAVAHKLSRGTEAVAHKLSRGTEAVTDAAMSAVRAGLHVQEGRIPVWPILVFIMSAVLCMGMSAAFHWFYVVSKNTADLLSSLDYAGISALITGSFVPVLYYGYYCNTGVRKWIYLALNVALCVVSASMAIHPKLKGPKFRTMRAVVFVTSGCFGVVPICELYFTGTMGMELLNPFLVMGAMYIGGATLYACRIPERFYPGRFDIVFASHQIFHILVFGAAVTHYFGVAKMYAWRNDEQCAS